MRRHCAGPVVAIDVSAPVDLVTESEDRDSLGFLDFLRQKISKKKGAVPSLIEILMLTAALSSIYHREGFIKQSDLYICPPIGGYPVLGWRNIDALVEIGYEFTRERLKQWPELTTLRAAGSEDEHRPAAMDARTACLATV